MHRYNFCERSESYPRKLPSPARIQAFGQAPASRSQRSCRGSKVGTCSLADPSVMRVKNVNGSSWEFAARCHFTLWVRAAGHSPNPSNRVPNPLSTELAQLPVTLCGDANHHSNVINFRQRPQDEPVSCVLPSRSRSPLTN